MSSIIIISHLFLFAFFLECNLAFLRINQTIFRQPQNNFEFIRCPIEFSSSWDIQWYDVKRQRYDHNRGRFYRIDTREENQRELICWSISTEDQVKFFIQIYGKFIGETSSFRMNEFRSTITNRIYIHHQYH